MLKLSTVIFVAGLLASANAGLADSAKSAAHPKAPGGNDKAAATMGSGSRALVLPPMDAVRGRKLFASKGCVVCHSVNGVGGTDAPTLDAKTMPKVMNPFDFAAKMWRGAETMIYVQREELGDKIEFTGDELAAIIAFVHDADQQKKFTEADIPPRVKKLMSHMGKESEEHEKEEHD